MKYLNLFMLASLFLSACVFSDKPKVENLVIYDDNEVEDNGIKIQGDSITVNTVMGDFRLFYKVSEILTPKVSSFGLLGSIEDCKIDKEIFLNIQKLDTTAIISYERLDIRSFESLITERYRGTYCINSFYLKEIRRDSIVFGVELCKFDQIECLDVDLVIQDTGEKKYILV